MKTRLQLVRTPDNIYSLSTKFHALPGPGAASHACPLLGFVRARTRLPAVQSASGAGRGGAVRLAQSVLRNEGLGGLYAGAHRGNDAACCSTRERRAIRRRFFAWLSSRHWERRASHEWSHCTVSPAVPLIFALAVQSDTAATFTAVLAPHCFTAPLGLGPAAASTAALLRRADARRRPSHPLHWHSHSRVRAPSGGAGGLCGGRGREDGGRRDRGRCRAARGGSSRPHQGAPAPRRSLTGGHAGPLL